MELQSQHNDDEPENRPELAEPTLADSISPEPAATAPPLPTTPLTTEPPKPDEPEVQSVASPEPQTETKPDLDEKPPTTPPQLALPMPRSHAKKRVIIVVAVLIIIVALAAGGWALYHMGNNHGYAKGTKTEQASMTAAGELKVPANATIVSQCTDGEGTQYVLPQNIPNGPIYNVWQNKVTGIEYMVGQSELLKTPASDMPLFGAKLNHVDMMYEQAGHAGFSEPHYHVILSLIPYADEQKIKCSGTSSDMSNMSM